MLACIDDKAMDTLIVLPRWRTQTNKIVGLQIRYTHANVRHAQPEVLTGYVVEIIENEMKRSGSLGKFTKEERWCLLQRITKFASRPATKKVT